MEVINMETKDIPVIARSVSCYYSWWNSCILLGEVTQDRKLVIKKDLCFTVAPVEAVAEILKENNIRPYIKKHQPLKKALGGWCQEVDFENEHESELDPLIELLEQLKAENRIILEDGAKIKGEARTKAVQLLLKSLVDPLCGHSNYCYGSIVREHPQQNYQVYRPAAIWDRYRS